MIFRLDVQKTIEAAATLLRLTRLKCMDRKRLLALLYLADRKSLEKTGRPIIGGRLVAMDHGPIHSEVYDFIKGGHPEQPKWSSYFSNDAYRVLLTLDPGVCALSRYEIDVLNEVSDEFIASGTWDVANATHFLEEYQKTYEAGTSTPIPLEAVIEAVGLGNKKDVILRDAEEKNFFDHLFTGEK